MMVTHDVTISLPFPLGVNSVFTRIAVGAHADIELLAVGARNQAFGPVMIDGAGGQSGQLSRHFLNLLVPRLVMNLDDGIGVSYVQCVAGEGHADGRVEALQEHVTFNLLTPSASIAQQCDSIGTGFGARARVLLGQLLYLAPYALPIFGLWRRVALSHQYIAVRQHIEPARMTKPSRHDGHARTWRGPRHRLPLPRFRLGDFYGRNE